MAPNPDRNCSRSFVSSSSSSSSSYTGTTNKYTKGLVLNDSSNMHTIETTTTPTALEFSRSSDMKKRTTLITSSFFYDHDYDDALDRFYNKKKSDSFYDRNYETDLFRFWKTHRSQFRERSSLERLQVLKTECGYSQTDINEVVWEVEKIRHQQRLNKKKTTTTQSRGRDRGRRHCRFEYKASARSFFLTKYNQKARMVINRAVHAPLLMI